MLRFGKTESLSIFLAAAILAAPVALADDSAIQLRDLLSCYSQLKPYSSTGVHAKVYPNDQGFVFLPGVSDTREGVYVYSDLGTSFVAIGDRYAQKPVAFDVNSSRGQMTVVYQPRATQKDRPQVWIRGQGGSHTTGVTVLYQKVDDAQRRQPLEAELDTMIRGMSKTWDMREDQLVQAVEDGKYLWVDVDLDHYKDAASSCLKSFRGAPEATNLTASLRGELAALNARATRSGVVKDDMVGPGFLSTPQY